MGIPVLSEDFKVFKKYLEDHNFNQNHFDYIVGSDSIRGRRGAVLLLGRWWRNPNYRNKGFAETLRAYVDGKIVSLVDVKWEKEDLVDLSTSAPNIPSTPSTATGGTICTNSFDTRVNLYEGVVPLKNHEVISK